MSVEISEGGRRLAVVVDDREEAIQVSTTWVRDACHCLHCRRPATNERRFGAASIEPDIRVVEARLSSDELCCRMSDGHDATVPNAQLVAIPAARPPQRRVQPTGAVAATTFASYAADDLDGRLGDLLDRLAADGAVIVAGVEPSDAGLRTVAELIAPIQSTNYGVTWSIDAVVEPVSEVESTRALAVHTDLPYRTDPPGVQLLLACETDVAGGASTFVDGFAAVDRLVERDARAVALLASVPVEFPYVRPDVEIVGRAPLIEVDHAGCPRVVRRAPDLRGSPLVDASSADAWFDALVRWGEVLDDAAFTTTVALAPGQLVVFDNHRMLHGRSAFELGASGRRVLRGCYLHRDDVASRRAVLAR